MPTQRNSLKVKGPLPKTPEIPQDIKYSAILFDRTKRADREKPGEGAFYRVATGRYPDDRDSVLAWATLDEGRDLKHPLTANVIHGAARANDVEFFIKLGKALGKKLDPYSSTTQLDRFLIDHWASRKDGLPELCFLTGSGLFTVCSLVYRNQCKDIRSVTIQRDRLGLISHEEFKLKVTLLKDGSLKFSVKDKKQL